MMARACQVETETFQTFASFGIATVLYIVAIAVIEAALQGLLHARTHATGVRR
ncbi:hypothetical protein [Paraburkholderia sp. B3]|uniref:hypothetical protein n=1 Tax=Paraburkholderia sp. B3 TaxID=3134791 RepID=UPI0039819DBD